MGSGFGLSEKRSSIARERHVQLLFRDPHFADCHVPYNVQLTGFVPPSDFQLMVQGSGQLPGRRNYPTTALGQEGSTLHSKEDWSFRGAETARAEKLRVKKGPSRALTSPCSGLQISAEASSVTEEDATTRLEIYRDEVGEGHDVLGPVMVESA